MPLTAGTRLGPYEVLAPLGAGGMGEVYRAQDTKLDRHVAVKILPEALAADPDRLARFEREAKVLASLNHPNIAQIYGLEERALIMELVEGETLSGPLPEAMALDYARQIASALEAAHEKNIVHRDLKPGNIMVTPAGVVKVLDFGLAAVVQDSPAGAIDPGKSPTLTMGATQVGTILGTASYMSPEQARGKPVDKRADIWAFGVVVYEMLTGRKLFDGEDVSETLAAVIKIEPRWDGVPANLQKLLKSCLEKDPKQRLRDIGDAWRLVEEPQQAAIAQQPGRRLVWPAATAALAAALAAVLWILWPVAPKPAEVVEFEISAPENTTLGGQFTLSPDGRKLAFWAGGRLWVRSLDSVEVRALPQAEGVADPPIWSPDSRFLVFRTANKLKRADVSGGPVQTLCDMNGALLGGAWLPDGTVLYGSMRGLYRVPAAGGVPALFLEGGAWPFLLPGGRHFIYLDRRPDRRGIISLSSLDAKPGGPAPKRLLDSALRTEYVASSDPAAGYVLFLREGALMAQRFDNRRLELTGEAVLVAQEVAAGGPPTNAFFSASANGVLVYRHGSALAETTRQLTWFDRQGKQIGNAGEPGTYSVIRLSPDGKQAAVASRPSTALFGPLEANFEHANLWMVDLANGAARRFTYGSGQDTDPVWSPDGSSIVFGSTRENPIHLYQKVASGAGDEVALLRSDENKVPNDWSRDGRFLLYSTVGANRSDSRLWVLPLSGNNRKPVPFLTSEGGQGRFSPDRRWIAYVSTESGRSEIWVRPFAPASLEGAPNPGGQWMVSTSGGDQPRWRADGKELFYRAGSTSRTIMSVEVSTNGGPGGAFQFKAPKPLFELPQALVNAAWDVTADGQRFLAATRVTGPAVPPRPITVVLNWTAGLKK